VKRTLIVAWIITLVVAALPYRTSAAAPRCYPASRFAVLSGGMVQDTLTGLVWQQDGSGARAGCGGIGLTCSWAGAKTYCSGLSLGGNSGWRLPTVKELSSIVDFTVRGPAIDQTAFPSTPSEEFWTSSPLAGSSGAAWSVYFYGGSSNYNPVSVGNRVRCVR
jgi:hypothetical protein